MLLKTLMLLIFILGWTFFFKLTFQPKEKLRLGLYMANVQGKTAHFTLPISRNSYRLHLKQPIWNQLHLWPSFEWFMQGISFPSLEKETTENHFVIFFLLQQRRPLMLQLRVIKSNIPGKTICTMLVRRVQKPICHLLSLNLMIIFTLIPPAAAQ